MQCGADCNEDKSRAAALRSQTEDWTVQRGPSSGGSRWFDGNGGSGGRGGCSGDVAESGGWVLFFGSCLGGGLADVVGGWRDREGQRVDVSAGSTSVLERQEEEKVR